MDSVLQWNINGIKTHLNDLKIKVKDTNPKVIAIQESHLKTEENFEFNGYVSVRKDYDGGQQACGGVTILIRKNLHFEYLNIQSPLQVVASVIYFYPAYPISICSVYIPNDVTPQKEDLLYIINQLPRPFIICGDFNAHSPQWGSTTSNIRGKALEQILTLDDIYLLNKPDHKTYLHPASGAESTIDFSLCNSSLAPKLDWNVFPQGFDHHPIVISINLRPNPMTDFLPRWKIDNADWSLFSVLSCFEIDENANIHEKIKEFKDKIISAANGSIPKTKPCKKKYAVAWWNEQCYLAIKERNRAFRNYRRDKTIENLIAYKKQRALVKRTVLESKRKSWMNFASSISSSTPTSIVWNRIKRINGNGKNNTAIKAIKINNEIIVLPSDIANIIGQFYERKSRERILPQTEPHDFNFSSTNEEKYNLPFTSWELETAIKSLRPHSSPGADEIHNQMIMHLPESTTALLLRLFNQIWRENVFPEDWKHSILVPIPKPGKDSTLPENLRPISLTSCLCKLFERIVLKRLNFFLESNKLIAPEQSGCRKNRSTLDNLISLQTEISDALVNKQYLLCTMFDIRAAYDSIQKNVILKQLHTWNMRGHLSLFLSNYMQTRSFQIRLNNSILSDVYSMECGLAQGGVLSCPLFAIGINAITSFIHPALSSSLFVDDYCIYMRDKDKDTLISLMQESINNLASFSESTGLFFSSEKTKAIMFSRKNKQNVNAINLTMGEQRIEVVNSARFLGLIFDRKLTWAEHLKNLKKSCYNRTRILKTLSKKAWGSNRKMLISLYKTLIRSKLDYGSIVYNSATSKTLQMLDPVQNQCLRLATGAFRSSPTASLEAETSEPNLKIRRSILTCNYIAKVMHHNSTNPNFKRINNPPYKVLYENSTKLNPTVGIQRELLMNDIPFHKVILQREPKESWLHKKPSCNLSLTLYKKDGMPHQVFQQEFQRNMNENYGDFVQVYTDGSKSDSSVGCAFVIPQLHIVKKQTLNPKSSIFHAELLAISDAVSTIKSQSIGEAVIISDSLSALQAISSMSHSNPLVQSIHEEISTIPNSTIKFFWCPSHVGIAGNDAADLEAKSALENPISHDVLFLEEIKTLTKMHFIHIWNNTWTETNPAHNKLRRIKASIFPWSSLCQKSRLDEVCIMRLRIGHTKVTHSFLFKREDPPTCEKCDAPLTVEHILLSCQNMRFRPSSFTNLSMSDILKDDPSSIDVLMRFLKRNNFLKLL
ncbi:hypothetical protein M8J77_013456 [Diaphorina citri]|nr:hypothetical protein M8J77_013456 [Diaphorina citri]